MKNIYIILLMQLFVACAGKTASENNKSDSTNVKEEILNFDSIKREKIFRAKGDTIFGNVLYGMNKQQAKASIKQFQDKFKNQHWGGFVFADTHFMDIEVFDLKLDDGLVDFDVNDHWGAELWKGKLSAVTWNSYCLFDNDPRSIEKTLMKFVSFFETKYGKPNSKYAEKSNWCYLVSDKWHFINSVIAEWDSKEHKVRIYLKWIKYPSNFSFLTKNTIYDFEYVLNVNFFNKSFLSEIDSIGTNLKKQHERNALEKRKKDSIDYINSL